MQIKVVIIKYPIKTIFYFKQLYGDFSMSLKSLVKKSVILSSTGLVLLLGAQNALAADKFGAIAYSLESGTYGYGTDYDSREEAESAALDACVEALEEEGQECSVELWFKNAYGALAEGDNGFGTGWGKYKQDAQLHALEKCQEYTTNCDITLTIGTE